MKARDHQKCDDLRDLHKQVIAWMKDLALINELMALVHDKKII